jgi:hypothetical protein
VDLGDRVLRPPFRTEAIRRRLEIRLEDRLEHQFQRGLHNPVGGRRDPEATDLARRFGDRLLPDPLGNEPAGFEIFSQPAEQRPSTEDDGAGCHSIDSGGSCTLVAPHPVPRHREERRVIDEVEQIIEATARIGLCPLVQLRLHPEYPHLGAKQVERRCAGIHQRPPRHAWMLRTRWTPSPRTRLSRARTTTGPPSHRDGIDGRCVFPPTGWLPAGSGTATVVPTFTLNRSTGSAPSFAPAASPRLRRRPSPWPPDRRLHPT